MLQRTSRENPIVSLSSPAFQWKNKFIQFGWNLPTTIVVKFTNLILLSVLSVNSVAKDGISMYSVLSVVNKKTSRSRRTARRARNGIEHPVRLFQEEQLPVVNKGIYFLKRMRLRSFLYLCLRIFLRRFLITLPIGDANLL